MTDAAHGPKHNDPLAFLAGGGEMGRRIHDFDWSSTPLGPTEHWPQSLRAALSICLNSNFPIALYWGPDLVLLYNDEWSPIPGEKHPWALGRPAREAWPEIWHIIEPLFKRVLEQGQAVRSRDQLLPMHRHGFTEECYFDYTFSPVRGEEGAVEGVFNAVLETTKRVVGERRLRTLRELATWKTGQARSAAEACEIAVQVMAENTYDLSFALLYLLDDDGRQALLRRSTLPAGHSASPPVIDMDATDSPWPFREVVASGSAVEVNDLQIRFGALPGGAWPEPTDSALVLPMARPGQSQPAGFVVAGLSPRLALDDDYRGFLDLLAGHVAAAVANARAYEEERTRAERLAELDRAKTAFFSNVSHEFRTPLTLMLGPLEDALADAVGGLSDENRSQLEVAHRNGLRLQRLVNTLLDFSRIEAGRVRVAYEPTDLAAYTTDLASVFRSACDKAGLRLIVDCPSLSGSAYVDREMWEKIVLNLLSNAFKFTFKGEIAVSLREANGRAELRVRDTGTGIPAEEMPRLFERFHRVENVQGRTHEGSGIGLALVQELVHLHGGTIAAESKIGKGTTFIVSVPLGHTHLPREFLRSERPGTAPGATAAAYFEEAMRWLPVEHLAGVSDVTATSDSIRLNRSWILNGDDEHRPRILVVDDNADMREYVSRLLSQHFAVESAPDGEAALALIRKRPPALVLTDVMMPRLDGFGLLEAVRADALTRDIPVIMLSARAGEESRVEGMEAGADDYLVKPFSGRELLARVGAHLQLRRMRRESERAVRRSEERFRVLFDTMTEGFAIDEVIFDDAGRPCDLRYLEVNPAFERHTGLRRTQILGRTTLELFPEAERDWFETYGRVVVTGVPEHFQARFGPLNRWFEVSAYKTGSNQVATVFFDITERKQAEKAVLESERRFRQLADAMPQIVWTADASGEIDYLNRRWTEFTGDPSTVGNEAWTPLMHPDDAPTARDRWTASVRTGAPFDMEIRLLDRRAQVYRWHLIRTVAVHDSDGRVVRWFGTSTDIDEQKRSEEASRYLAQASAALASVVDYESTLQIVANLAVPHFADWAAVDVADDDGGLCRLAVAHDDASKVALVHRLMRDYPPDPQAPTGALAVYRNGAPEFVAEITDDMLVRGAKDERHLALIRSLGLRSYICVPLVVSGKPLGVLTFATAESGRRYTEADLALAGDLAARAGVAVENNRLYQALREADRRKDEFLATLAHELRNPLAPIRNSLQVLKMPRVDAATAAHTRDIMERQVHHLVRLVDDLLDVSRVMRGKVELRRERVELAAVVARAVETATPLIELQGHRLDISFPQEPLLLDADPVRLAQVVGNLLTNAAKYMESNGSIRLSARRHNGAAVLSVRDDGIGIAPEMLPHVFDLFVQADVASTKAHGGLGIGLTLVKNLVELHGGSVTARSDGLGKGSEFIVRLPILASAVDRGELEEILPRVKSPTPNGRRLLVVDDNPDVADSFATLLRLQGHDVRVAHSGTAALETTKTFTPEVIFLDIGMPGMDGFEVAQEIRRHAGLGDLVLVALTGWGQPEDRRRTAEAGFNHHLVKPPEPKAIESILAGLNKR